MATRPVRHDTFKERVRNVADGKPGTNILSPLRAEVACCPNDEQWQTIPDTLAVSYLERLTVTLTPKHVDDLTPRARRSFYCLVETIATKLSDALIQALKGLSELAYGKAMRVREETLAI